MTRPPTATDLGVDAMSRTRLYGTVAAEGLRMISVRRNGERVILDIDGTPYPLANINEAEDLARYLKRGVNDAVEYDPNEED